MSMIASASKPRSVMSSSLSGGILKIHSGPFATGKDDPISCNQEIIDFYWTGQKVWNNDGDEAWLYRPDGSVAYYYYYPLLDRAPGIR